MKVLILTILLAILKLDLLYTVTARSISNGGKLLELSCSPQQMSGKYTSHDGIHGITFSSRADGHLLIRSLSGETIVETSQFSVTNGRELRLVTIMGHEYHQHTNSAHSDQPVDHDTSLRDALQKLLDRNEIILLKEAAEAVGQRGINGKTTPAAMPFFMFALRATQLHTEGPHNVTSSLRNKRQSYAYLDTSNPCLTTCPPCPDEACYGLCGYGCWCWSFLCGDCCYHIGCYYHDTCCRSNFYQTRCLLPYDFSCEQVYSF